MNSFIGWVGGKRLLRKEIINRFPEKHPLRYVEVFGGAGWVMFEKEKKAKQEEIFNDFDGELINLYRCIKYHPDELVKELRFLPHSKEIFQNMKSKMSINGLGLTDIQRAAIYFYTIKRSFGSKKDSFATSYKNIDTVLCRFEEIQERLSKVVIENRDFEKLINIYDREESLFYLDPPYFGTENLYTAQFLKGDHIRLKETLDNIKGKFILSYNNCEFIKDMYKNYNIEEISRLTTLSAKSNVSNFNELIITNY